MDELFEVLTLIQTKKVSRVPVILFGVNYWKGLKLWIKEVMGEEEGNINPIDMDLIPSTDDIEEVIQIINDYYEGEKQVRLRPNYEL
jgi:predicted Rossmann-fold nucleotide-binding protein